jgi:putative Mn2+ efflux pump MntP
MTIVLHWWLLPVLFALVGSALMTYAGVSEKCRGFLGGLFEALGGLVLVLLAAAICLGHYL